MSGDDPDATEFVTGVSPMFIIQRQGKLYLVNNFDRPYVEDVEAEAENIQELRVRKAFQEHRAWLSVDLLGEEPPEKLPEVYRQIGKLVAELADTDCLALYSPATQQMVPYDAALEEELRGPDAMEAFRRFVQVPVFGISGDDPRMQAAVAEARRRWPEFVAAFERRTPRHKFAVKAPFTEGEHTEFMWLMVTALEGDRILGTLENEPVELKRLRYGSKVSVRCADLNDWVISDGQNVEAGGFTIKVFEDLQ